MARDAYESIKWAFEANGVFMNTLGEGFSRGKSYFTWVEEEVKADLKLPSTPNPSVDGVPLRDCLELDVFCASLAIIDFGLSAYCSSFDSFRQQAFVQQTHGG